MTVDTGQAVVLSTEQTEAMMGAVYRDTDEVKQAREVLSEGTSPRIAVTLRGHTGRSFLR